MNSSQLDPTNSAADGSTPADEPPPKISKISQPNINKVPAPSLVNDGPRQRKITQPFSLASLAVWKPKYTNYEFEGKRLVNMGYFIKSLQALNDHGSKKCNFSDMRVCSETKKGWNVGVKFTCNLCPSTKVIWMEDPDIKEPPQIPIVFKSHLTVIKTTQKSSLVGAPTATAQVQKKLLIAPPAPKILKFPRSYWRKTPPPDEEFLQKHAMSPELTMPVGQPKYPRTLLLRPGTTVRYGPLQTPFPGHLLVRPVIGQHVPTIAESQRSIVNHSIVPVISQPPVSVVELSQVPFADFPQVASIKQEIILPDDGTNTSFINPSRVEMTFCVEQDEKTESVTSDTAMTENIAAAAFAQTGTSLQSSSGQASLSTAMDPNVTNSIAPTETLPVNLNLVKKEVVD